MKLPRTDVLKTPFWLRILPFKTHRKKVETVHLERERALLKSFRLSLDELKNQTGVLSLHWGISSGQTKKVTIVDKLGLKYHLSLEKTFFLLQYKYPILMQIFSDALQKGDRKKAEKILDALVQVIAERAEKGVLNRDRSFLKNFGYDGEKAYQIDIGTFFQKEELSPQAAYQKSLRDSLSPVQEWLAKTDPQMLQYLNNKYFNN